MVVSVRVRSCVCVSVRACVCFPFISIGSGQLQFKTDSTNSSQLCVLLRLIGMFVCMSDNNVAGAF